MTNVNITVGEQIWEEIKNIKISMFALPSQTIDNYCKMIPIEPSKCYVTYTVSSFLPALEEAVGSAYTCELVEKYIVISRKKVIGN